MINDTSNNEQTRWQEDDDDGETVATYAMPRSLRLNENMAHRVRTHAQSPGKSQQASNQDEGSGF